MTQDFEIAVIISGRGSNLKSLLESARNYRISAVLSNRDDAPGLAFAKEAGIPCHTFPRSEYVSVAVQKTAIFAKIDELSPRLVCLAGYLQVVPGEFVARNFGRVVNIHPSLLPEFPGLDTHKRAIDAGARTHGCSVHYIDTSIDTGPLIAQAALDMKDGEEEAALAARVLELEHRLYPWVVNGIASGEIRLENHSVSVSPALTREAERLGFILPRLEES